MNVALLTASGFGLGAAAVRELRAQSREVAGLFSSRRGKALAKALGGLGVTYPNIRRDGRLVRVT